MKIFFGALLLIITLGCLGYVIFLCKDGFPDAKEDTKKALKVFGVIVVGCICGFGGNYILGTFDNTSTPAEEREKEEFRQKVEACQQQTNTYYKCSWSNLENRCVCKQR